MQTAVTSTVGILALNRVVNLIHDIFAFFVTCLSGKHVIRSTNNEEIDVCMMHKISGMGTGYVTSLSSYQVSIWKVHVINSAEDVGGNHSGIYVDDA